MHRSGFERISATLLVMGALHYCCRAEATRFEPEVQWVTVRNPKQIPDSVLNALLSHFVDDRRLADRSEPFNATDIGSTLPSRRLVLAGHSRTEWFVAYEHGGRGHHLDLVVLDVRGAVVRTVLSTSLNAGTHDDRTAWRLELTDVLPMLSNGTRNVKSGDRVHY